MPDDDDWNLKPRTRAKLQLLDLYLTAWFKILSNALDVGGRPKFSELVYLDGFCGRGEYTKGEPGSPVIAIKHARAVAYARPDLRIQVIYIDKSEANIAHLRQTLTKVQLPSNLAVHAESGDFQDTVVDIFGRLNISGQSPTFSFVDPYGVIPDPEDCFGRLIRNRSSELFVNFMAGYVNRFLDHPDPKTRDTFASSISRHEIHELERSTDRLEAITAVYSRFLRRYGKYVRVFQMRDETNVRDNALIFCGNSRLGFKKMKEAMWKVDPIEGNNFSAFQFTRMGKQSRFSLDRPDLRPLEEDMLSTFKGRRYVSKADIQDWADFESERYLYSHARFVIEKLVRSGRVIHHSQPAGARKRRIYTWSESDQFSFQ